MLKRVTAATAVLLLTAAAAAAHDSGAEAGRPIEPPTFAVLNAGLGLDPTTQPALDLWAATQKWQATTLTVCFWQGTPATRLRVARKMDGMIEGTTLTFDFGAAVADGATLRDCTGSDSAMIRIGFDALDPHGPNWSLVGRDSLRTDWPKSVNLAGILEFPGQFDRIVAHEILHALGRMHELQHPAAMCQDHIKWDLWQSDMLARGWTVEQFDFNIRDVYFQGMSLAGPTCDTVMMYFVEPRYLVDGAADTCFCRRVDDVTDHDRTTLIAMYDPAPGADALVRIAGSAGAFPEGSLARTLISQDLQAQLARASGNGTVLTPEAAAAIGQVLSPQQLLLNDIIRIEPSRLDPRLLRETLRIPSFDP